MPSSRSTTRSRTPWKRFQDDTIPHVPILTLDREGNIESLTPAARRLLEYPDGASLDECFFTHVHKHNLSRVMRDLADMVSRGKQRTQWLLRLRTGNDRWRWYRASVQNNLGRQEDHIRVRLRSL
jgi:PAS domain-containing protein